MSNPKIKLTGRQMNILARIGKEEFFWSGNPQLRALIRKGLAEWVNPDTRARAKISAAGKRFLEDPSKKVCRQPGFKVVSDGGGLSRETVYRTTLDAAKKAALKSLEPKCETRHRKAVILERDGAEWKIIEEVKQP